MDLIAHLRLAVRLPLVTGRSDVLALGLQCKQGYFLKDRPALEAPATAMPDAP